jgi:caspase domain-containing protein
MVRYAYALIGCLMLVTAGHAAERRVALVIGNSAYKQAPLANPGNDARAMAQVLREQMELRDEARRYWKALAAERP